MAASLWLAACTSSTAPRSPGERPGLGQSPHPVAEAFDLNPGDPPKAFITESAVAGVWFPADFVPAGTNVIVTDLTPFFGPGQSPLQTPLDKYPSYIDIQLIPKPASMNGTPIVVVCFPEGLAAELAERLLLGHQSAPGDPAAFKVYPSVPVPPELAQGVVCGDGLNLAMSAPQRWLRRAANVLLPERLYAHFFSIGGVGGSPEEFSPFGAVDPVLRVGGVGGSPEEFAPSALPVQLTGPFPGPPAGWTVGQIGQTGDDDLPAVTVETFGFDGDVNPVPGVSVRFTLGPALARLPMGDARFCSTPLQPLGPPSVTVVTGADGRAELPCIHFGTAIGFSNLTTQADGASLGFLDGARKTLVTIIADGSDPPTSILNFLVEATAGVPSNFTLEQAPATDGIAGQVLEQQPRVQLRDDAGHAIELAGVSVTAVLTSGPGQLIGTLAATTDARGVASFTNLRIDGAAGVYALAFLSRFPTLPGGTITIAPGPPNRLVMVTGPGTAQAGVPSAPAFAVRLVDAFGNSTPVAGVTVSASLASGPGALVGDLQAATDQSGVANFPGLIFTGPAGVARVVGFAATGLTGTTGSPVEIVAGAATSLVVEIQPSGSARAGEPFAIQPAVGLRDAFGNIVTSLQVQVTAVLVAGEGTLEGTVTRATTNGVASFADLRVDGAIGSRAIRFVAGGLVPATSSPIVVGSGTAARLRPSGPGIIVGPSGLFEYGSGLPSFVAVKPPPAVQVTDLFGNPVGAGTVVTWAGNTINGAVLDIGSGGTTDGSGIAQVAGWTPGVGANTLEALLVGGTGAPAVFLATTVGGEEIFSCQEGGSRPSDLAPFSIPSPPGDFRQVTVFISMEVDPTAPGASPVSLTTQYPVSLTVHRNDPSGPLLGQVTGTSTLPGRRTRDTGVTFRFPTPIIREPEDSRLYFTLQVTTPPGRKPLLWYNPRVRSDSPCWDATLLPPTGSPVRGLSILIAK